MKLFFILFVFFLSAPSGASTQGLLHEKWELQAAYVEDSQGRLTLEEVLALPPLSWKGVPRRGVSFGFRNEAFWFRVPLPACEGAGSPGRILEIAYPLLNDIQLWMLEGEQPGPFFKTGDERPYAERPIDHLNFGFPYTCGVHQTALVRVQSSSSLQLPMNIWERHAFEKHALTLERPQFLYFGALLVMALYNFFIYLIVRRPPYVHYVLFALSIGIFQAALNGMAFRYLWPNFPAINEYVVDKATNCIALFAFAFCLSFLQARTLTPRLYRLGVWLITTLVLYSFLSFALPYGLAIKISIVYVVLAIALVFLITVISIRKRQREGYFYGIAWTAFLIGTIFLSFNKLGLLPRTALTENSLQIASVLEMLLLSFALADQMNILRFNLARSHQQLEKTLSSIEEIVDQKTQSIRSIMNTLKEGVLTIAGQEFVIEAEYSLYTELLLGERQLGGRRFQDVFLNRLILGEDAKALIISALQAIMDESSDNFAFNSFHLPQEARLMTASGSKDIMIDWTPIHHEGRVLRILIAFHDVTELRSLKQEQATQSRMLIRLNQLLNADDMALRVFLIHSRRTLDLMHDHIQESQDRESLVEKLFINFHTLKGESRSLGLAELSEQFHHMEERLDHVRKRQAAWDPGGMRQELLLVEKMVAEFAELYESHIGALTEERVIAIKQGQLERWEQALVRLKPQSPEEDEAQHLLLNDVFHILHTDLESYEEKLQNQARRLAREIGKPDPQVLVAGQGIFLSQRMVEQLDHVFIHILQNALVHGIESEEERVAAGKGKAGLIYIKFARLGDEVVISARDDGHGVNMKLLRQKAIKLGILRSFEELSESKVQECLLHAGFSSRDHVTNHAGRGVGMGAVRQFVEEIEGRMHLEFLPERDGHRTFALVMNFPAHLFPTLKARRRQVA
jgi:HPt (histidine-containing phosphotransfer) domain-containing protein